MVQKWLADLNPKPAAPSKNGLPLPKKTAPRNSSLDASGSNSDTISAATRHGGSLNVPMALATAACIEDQYSGKQSVLRPLYDELLRLAKSLGPDVKAGPCKTIVPLFGAGERGGLDLGLYFTILVFSLFRPARRLFCGLQWRNRGLIAASTSLFARRSPRIQGFFPPPSTFKRKKAQSLAPRPTFFLLPAISVVLADQKRRCQHRRPQSPLISHCRLRNVHRPHDLV
jgi:hypothetical protein